MSVINFSEGRDSNVFEDIAASVGLAGARVMDWSMDEDHHRGVMAVLGDERSLPQAVIAAGELAIRLIDLREHYGEHPRFGAMDVVPIVPLEGSTYSEAVEISRQIGCELAERLNLPVYLYEKSASRPERVNLAEVRRIGRLGLEANLTGFNKPDFGPEAFHPTAGAVAIGARGPLVAYNINLSSGNLDAARTIASRIREIRDRGDGLPGVKALGMMLHSDGIAQVSTNVCHPDICRPSEVFRFVRKAAGELGVDILESELVGIVSEAHLRNDEIAFMRFSSIRDCQFIENHTNGLGFAAC